MSYLHVELLLAPLLAAALAHLGQRRGLDVKHWGYGLGVLCVIASIWTTPWDNWMVATGVWGYPPSAVLGTIWHIPVEEQAFFVVQTLMTGAWFGLLIDPTRPRAPRSAAARACAALGALGMVASGVFAFREGHTYLGSMLAWFGVPLAVQFAWGADQLGRHVHAIVPGIALPTIILCVVDTLAVQQGTWFFDEGALVGIQVGALPLEEVVFFALTNTLVVVGLALWMELREQPA